MDFYSGFVDWFITLTMAASVLLYFLYTGATDLMVRVQLGGSLAVAPCWESTHQAIVAGGAGTLIGFMLPRLRFDTSRFGLVIWLVSDGKVKVLVGDNRSQRKDRLGHFNSCLSQFGRDWCRLQDFSVKCTTLSLVTFTGARACMWISMFN